MSARKLSGLFFTLILFLLVSYFNKNTRALPKKNLQSVSPTPLSLISQKNTILGTTESAKSFETVKVVRVIDGDTIEIESGRKVRYIGINTPETHDPRKPVECFGKQAAAKNKELVEGKEVKLEKDVSETDRYSRLLRFVYIDGIFVNDYLVRQGYAQIDTVSPDVAYAEQFKTAEKEAREYNRGLWNSCK